MHSQSVRCDSVIGVKENKLRCGHGFVRTFKPLFSSLLLWLPLALRITWSVGTGEHAIKKQRVSGEDAAGVNLTEMTLIGSYDAQLFAQLGIKGIQVVERDELSIRIALFKLIQIPDDAKPKTRRCKRVQQCVFGEVSYIPYVPVLRVSPP